MNNAPYRTLSITLLVSFIVMYCVMFLNITQLDYFYISLTRLYMAILMVAPMAIIMMVFMGSMYKKKKWNTAIIAVSILVFAAALTGLRTQTFVADEMYMRAMIPHHSSAILTSEHAHLKHPEVRKLADDIIKAQKEEIAQMQSMLERLDKEK